MPFYLEETPDTKVQFVGVPNSNDGEIQKLQKKIDELTAKLAGQSENPFAKKRADYESKLNALKDNKVFLFIISHLILIN